MTERRLDQIEQRVLQRQHRLGAPGVTLAAILNVDQAAHVMVIKRSMNPGFAGIDNPLFNNDNSLMLFADGRQAVVASSISIFRSRGSFITTDS